MKIRLLMIGMILPLVTIGYVHAEPPEFTVAKVQWIPDSHSSDGFAAIQVIEPDMNLSPNEIEKFKIRIWSDSDPKGISPDVYETSKDSGVFVSNIYFSSNPSTGQRLHTIEEDLVIASYEDHTLPASYADDSLEILDSMIIRKTLANPDLSPSYALDFAGGLIYGTIMPLAGLFVGVSALFLTPYFILKRKNIPSRPYLALILAGILLFFTIPNFVSSLEFIPYLISHPEQIRPYIFEQVLFRMWWQIAILTIVGILLYRSSVIRNLIKK